MISESAAMARTRVRADRTPDPRRPRSCLSARPPARKIALSISARRISDVKVLPAHFNFFPAPGLDAFNISIPRFIPVSVIRERALEQLDLLCRFLLPRGPEKSVRRFQRDSAPLNLVSITEREISRHKRAFHSAFR